MPLHIRIHGHGGLKSRHFDLSSVDNLEDTLRRRRRGSVDNNSSASSSSNGILSQLIFILSMAKLSFLAAVTEGGYLNAFEWTRRWTTG